MKAATAPLGVSKHARLQDRWLPKVFGRQNVMDAKKPSRM